MKTGGRTLRSAQLRRRSGRIRGCEEICRKWLRHDSAQRGQHPPQFQGWVTRPGRAGHLHVRSQSVAPFHVEPTDPRLAVCRVAGAPAIGSDASWGGACLRLSTNVLIAMRALGFRCGGIFLLGGGHHVVRHGYTVFPCPGDFLRIRVTATGLPALLSGMATAAAVFTWESLLRAFRLGVARQRNACADKKLLRNEQPRQQPSRTSCAEHRHTPTRYSRNPTRREHHDDPVSQVSDAGQSGKRHHFCELIQYVTVM